MTSEAKHTPVTNKEAKFLHDLGWNSGHGWKCNRDWYWQPSYGDPIWIEDDIGKMNLWLRDRDVYAEEIRQKRARHNALELLGVLEEVEEYFDQRADAEYLPGQAAPIGNEEMRLLTIVRAALAKSKSEPND